MQVIDVSKLYSNNNSSNSFKRHKVFISCYYNEGGRYKDTLESWNEQAGIFVNQSVQEYEIDDNLPDEEIRKIIRDYYIRDSTVTIVLCGPDTRRRKFVDWELHATMYDTQKNPKGGILAISLPCADNCEYAAPGDRYWVPNAYKYRDGHEQEWLEEHFPDIPDRLFWSIMDGVPITVVDWEDVYGHPEVLGNLIDSAYRRRKTNRYRMDIPLRRRNS